MAGLLKYFRRQSKQNLSVLPDPKGSLSEKVPSSSIELTNDIVHDIIDEKTTSRGKRGEYLSLTPAQKFSIGKRAAENGVTATIRYYAKAFPDLPLSKLKHRLYRLRNRDNTRRYFTRAINVVQNGVYSGGYIMAIHILLDSATT